LLFLGNSVKVLYQPKGVVGVIVPWNFPIYLAMGPLVTALAAGNRVMIKMSEVTPATNAVFKTLLGEVFGEDLVAVVGEELVDPNVFTSLPFDHIVFTGSPAVGKIVMRTAAHNLTPGDTGTRRQVAGDGHAQLSGGRCGAAHHARQVGQLRADLHRAGLRAGAARERRCVRSVGQEQLRAVLRRPHRGQPPTSPASSATGSSSA
jgi:hypothetical protein